MYDFHGFTCFTDQFHLKNDLAGLAGLTGLAIFFSRLCGLRRFTDAAALVVLQLKSWYF